VPSEAGGSHFLLYAVILLLLAPVYLFKEDAPNYLREQLKTVFDEAINASLT
jgi:hypothetical protein